MSIELPEAKILADQMQAALPGKTVTAFDLRGCESLQRVGFVNKDLGEFEALVGQTVIGAVSRGNTIVVQLTAQQRLILAPEYGGEISLLENARSLPAKYHLRLDFAGGEVLTVRLTGMGAIFTVSEDALEGQYMVRRDFDPGKPEPDDPALTAETFSRMLEGASRQLKPVLVGKDAVVVGLSNASFQDIVHRAALHPKWRAADLDPAARQRLYEAMRSVVAERLRLGGKTGFHDLHGKPGTYEAAMGPAFKGRLCPICGTAISKLALGGGDVFVCPRCQPAPA